MVTIGEAASKIGVSIDTIRRWDKKGLIKSNRMERNYRFFNVEEIERLNNKLNGKSGKSRYKILKNEKKTNYSSVELFAGAGGTALGFENAGINHVLLNEWDKKACDTLRTNRPKWNVVEGDVKDLNFKEGMADVVQGGFPCQSFSYAGKSMGFNDIRGTLFFEFARCVKEVRPKIAVGENVKGLVQHDGGKTLSVMVNV
ncbi:MAG: DNA (cytosine-5-)-methyltransferase, partial [Proteobacteria bacterium]|nr:DNA (cytosine-5-)-methyltransferase [Pseudomonadota bacterium]